METGAGADDKGKAGATAGKQDKTGSAAEEKSGTTEGKAGATTETDKAGSAAEEKSGTTEGKAGATTETDKAGSAAEEKSGTTEGKAGATTETKEGAGAEGKAGKSAKVDSQQITKVKTHFSQHKPTVKSINKTEVSVSIGVAIPGTLVLYDLPPDVIVVVGDCPIKYFVWGDDVVLVDSCTREVVEIIVGVA
jgi:hypothetical protein